MGVQKTTPHLMERKLCGIVNVLEAPTPPPVD